MSFCSGGGGSLYDVNSCLAAWSHVPSRRSPSKGLCPAGVSVQGVSVKAISVRVGSLSRRSLARKVSVQGSLYPGDLMSKGFLSTGVSVQGGLCLWALCQEDSPDRDPHTVKSRQYTSDCNDFLILQKITPLHIVSLPVNGFVLLMEYLAILNRLNKGFLDVIYTVLGSGRKTGKTFTWVLY